MSKFKFSIFISIFCLVMLTQKSTATETLLYNNIYQLHQIDNSYSFQMSNQGITNDLFLNTFQMAKKEKGFDFEEMLEKIMDTLQGWIEKIKEFIKDFQK